MGMRQYSVLLVPLLAAGLIAGCAHGPASTAGQSPAPSPASSSAPPTGIASGEPAPTAVPSAPPAPPGTPAPTGGDLTISGQIETGAEPSCLLLRSGGKLYLLNGGNPAIVKAGSTVTVRGRVVHVMSHCMQGEPFQVTEAYSQ